MPKVIVEKTEFLSVKDLTNLARAYKPVSSDGVATAIKYGKNKMGQNIVQLFLTYVNGRTLLKIKNNVLIVVSADGVSNEIKKIFGNDDVVILK